MVRRQRRETAIGPYRDERFVRGAEVECDREFVGRDIRRLNQVVTSSISRAKFRIVPKFPGVIYIVSVEWLTIRPYHVRAQLERPGFEIGRDVAIRLTWNFCRQASMKHALRISVEERGINSLIDQKRIRFPNAIGDQRINVFIQVVGESAAFDWGATTAGRSGSWTGSTAGSQQQDQPRKEGKGHHKRSGSTFLEHCVLLDKINTQLRNEVARPYGNHHG